MARPLNLEILKNDYSVLLALFRRQMTSRQFKTLLAIHQAVNLLGEAMEKSPGFSPAWMRQFEVSLQQAFESLEKRRLHRHHPHRLLHLWGHLFWHLERWKD